MPANSRWDLIRRLRVNDTLKQKVNHMDPNYEEITAYNKNDSKTELKNNAPWT